MIGDTIGLTYNAVAKTLVKINQDGYGAVYWLDDYAVSQRIFKLEIKHTLATAKTPGASHLIKLTVTDMSDPDSPIVCEHWEVMRTNGMTQVTASSVLAQAAFLTVATVGNTTKVLGLES